MNSNATQGLVVHTLAYLRGTLPLGLKGRFYAIVAFVCLMGTFLCQASGVKEYPW